MLDKEALYEKAREGILSVNLNDKYKNSALENLASWIRQEEFSDYLPQIAYWIENQKWNLLIDSFFQIIPFGTGGRRGLVGIGTNRINKWTIQNSAQGHSQYLLKKHPDAKERGIVITYGVRVFLDGHDYDPATPNPVLGLTAKELAFVAAEVYTANGIRVHIAEDYKATPELSFMIRHLKAIGGAMIDASHNAPTDCGKKIYDSKGGQLIPPFDQELTDEVTKNVAEVATIPFKEAEKEGLIRFISRSESESYYAAVADLSLSKARELKIVYAPLHGPGLNSVYPILRKAGFEVTLDPLTSNLSGKFENVKFNIPNPEVEQSFENSLPFAVQEEADIILSTDPDADRIGIIAKSGDSWKYFTGNEIGIMLTGFVIEKQKKQNGIIIKTEVTSGLIEKIAKENNVTCIGNLLVGFKYIGEEMNKLEDAGRINDFLLGCEESHGYIAGNYARDKDAAIAALWLAELAAEQKTRDKTLADYLNDIYCHYGYFKNYLTEIRIPGADGLEKIQKIQGYLRNQAPKNFGAYTVISTHDHFSGESFLSETDKSSRDVLVFHLETPTKQNVKITARPSGTEPKIKFYFEISTEPCKNDELSLVIEQSDILCKAIEKEFLNYCYKIIGVDFPDRGYLLFWQLPLNKKLQYFEIEDKLSELDKIDNLEEKRNQLASLLSFLGSDPIEKIDNAFRARFGKSVREHLNI